MRSRGPVGRSGLSFALIAALTLLAALTTSPAFGAGEQDNGRATHIIVFHEGVDPDAAARDLEIKHGVKREHVYRTALRGMSGVVPPGREQDILSDPRVAFIEPNQVVTAFDQTTPRGIDRIDAEGAGGTGDVNVDVAVLDTGVDLDHPDLRVFRNFNCTAGCGEGGGDDPNGHGTHVAGIAAARNNTIGVRGVAPGARLWSVKVLGPDGSGFVSWVVAGVDLVTFFAGEVEIANMSLGGEFTSSSLNTAIANSVKAGVTYAVAAGNAAKDAAFTSPANHPDVLTVSAIADSDGRCGGLGAATPYGADDTFATFSNFGAVVDLAAPGVGILSTYKGGAYATLNGTSMASPHVAGAAALYKAANPAAKPIDVRNALIIGGVPQTKVCDTSLNDGNGGFSGDKDIYPERLVYVGITSAPAPDTTPPAAPTGLTATAGDSQVSLDWANNVEADLAGYNVYRSTTSGGPYTKINASTVTASAYTDTGLINGTTYYFVVTAVDTSGNESARSSEAFATPAVLLTLSVGVATDKASYAHGEWVDITVTVTDGTNPVAGAAVHMEVTTANGKKVVADGTTGASGQAKFRTKVNKKSQGCGTYKVDATASKAGYNTGSGATTYAVAC